MTEKKEKTLEGFGHTYTAAEWRELLDMSRSLFDFCTEEEGMSIEELYKFRGFKFKPKKERKQRRGPRMDETRQIIYQLMVLSGYPLEEGAAGLTVKPLDTNGNHLVHIKKHMLGVYNYKAGTLTLKNGQGMPLRELMDGELDARLRRTPEGFWELHPATQRLLVDRAIEKRKSVEVREPDAPASTRELYEGFGQKLTCAAWCRRLGIPQKTLWRRLQRGHSIEDIAADRKNK